MTGPLITTIYFDMGWTLRHTVKDPARQHTWLSKIIAMTGLPWTPAEMGQRFTERALAYKKWGEESLIEVNTEELWLRWLLPELPQDFVQANALELNRYWRWAIGEGTLFPHTVEVIRELFQRGYRLGIISNTVSPEETPNLIKKYGIEQYFETVILSCDFGKRKPDPSIFHAATGWMGVDPANCAYVGDQMDRDILGSKRAGFPVSILVKHFPDAKSPEIQPTEKPDFIIHSLPELLEIFPKRYLKTISPMAKLSSSGIDAADVIGAHPRWNVSLSTMWSCENRVSLPDLLPILDTLQVSGIELNHGVRSEDLTGHDLGCFPIRSLHEPCPADVSLPVLFKKDWQISAVDEQKRQQGVRMIMRSIDLAQALGVHHLVVHPGNCGLTNADEKLLRKLLEAGREETDEYQSLKRTMIDRRKSVIESRMNSVVRSMKELLDYASGKNLRLALENRYHLMDIPSPDEMGLLLDLAGPDQLGVQFDIGHAQTLDVLGFYPFMEWVHRFAPRIIGLHLHDVRGVEDHYAPGLGEVDYRQFAKFIPADAQRTLEVHGTNSLRDLSTSLQILAEVGLIHRNHSSSPSSINDF